MGKQNLTVNRMLERKEIFADLINGTIFAGQQVLVPEHLELLSGQSGVITQEKSRDFIAERRGDIRMKADTGTYSVTLAAEVQGRVHYAMVVRNFLYEALEYTKQVQELEKLHRQRGDQLQNDEFLSGIKKEDKLHPVVMTVLYFGKEWDGSISLRDMIAVDEEDPNYLHILQYLPDYKIHLVQVNKIEEPGVFKTCLQHIFSMLKYNDVGVKRYFAP